MPTKTGYLRCTDGFCVGRRVVKRGQVVTADDPIVKGRERLFAPLEDDKAIANAAVAADQRMMYPPRNRDASLIAGGNNRKRTPRKKAAATEDDDSED